MHHFTALVQTKFKEMGGHPVYVADAGMSAGAQEEDPTTKFKMQNMQNMLDMPQCLWPMQV